jgi:hypothetical protein
MGRVAGKASVTVNFTDLDPLDAVRMTSAITQQEPSTSDIFSGSPPSQDSAYFKDSQGSWVPQHKRPLQHYMPKYPYYRADAGLLDGGERALVEDRRSAVSIPAPQ